MKLVEAILTKNPCYTAGRKITVKGLMLHSVGCPQPSAQVFVKNWNSASYDRACVHGFIDANDGTVYQTLPWDHRGWHCASGNNGSGNNTHIGVEMCEPSCITYTGGSSFTCSNTAKAKECAERTYQSAVELFAMLCQKFNLNPLADGVIISHREGHARGIASNHGDPEHLWNQLKMGYTMDTFRKAVSAKMGNVQVDEPAKPATNDSFPAVPFLVNVIIDDLNIRTSAGMGNNLTGKYTGKGTFTIVEVQNGWGRLKSGAGWIYLKNPEYCTIGKSVASTTTPVTEPAKPAVSGTASTEADAETIWNNLKVWIENDYGVAGLMGNLYAESGLRSNNLQNTYEKSLGLSDAEYTAKVDDGSYINFIKDSAGYGLAQWTYWSRKQMLKEFADWLNTSIGDLQMQLSFLQKEITQNYASMLKTLQGAKSVKEASDAVLTVYERPADQGDSVKSKRASYGQKYFDQFHKQETVEPDTKKMYYVQVGAFSKKENADACLKKAKGAGFTDAFIKEG